MRNWKVSLQVSAFTILLYLCPGCLTLEEFGPIAVLLTKLMARKMLIPFQFPAEKDKECHGHAEEKAS